LHQLVSRLNSTSTASDISLAASFGMIPPGCPQRIDEFNSSIDCLVKKSHDCLDKAKMHGINAAQRMFYKQALLLVTMSALSIPSVLMAVMTNDFYDTLSLTVNSIWLCSVGMDVWYAWKDWSAKVKGEAELPMASDSLANLLHYFAHKRGYSDTSSQSIAVVGSSIFRFIRATATVLSGRLVPFDTPHNLTKPYEEYAGSGMHVHISMLDAADHNAFARDDGSDSPLLKRALAGMIDLMPASMALLAPNVNAFRRFLPDAFVPLQASWGHNNRTVALRIPCGDLDNHRVEYRVAGADANPYLVVAAILAGILHGIDNQLPLPPPVKGNGHQAAGNPLPIRQSDALVEFEQSYPLQKLLGKRFGFVWHSCKHHELMHFERLITATEIDWMLKNA